MTASPAAATAAFYASSANNRLKASFDSWMWVSMIAAVVLHFSVFALWPELTAPDISVDKTVIDVVPPPEVHIPEPPKPIERPAMPLITSADVPLDVTISPTTFDANPVSELSPPPPEVRADPAAAGGFTPFTVAPEVLNPDEVVRAMRREYPTALRDSGIGGTVKIRFHIDEQGHVLETQLGEASSYESLNDAALSVAEVVRFAPAWNRDKRVAVWVEFPIVFQVLGCQEP